MTNEGEVYFALYGNNFAPDEVTRLIGLEATSIIHEAIPRYKQTVWRFSSGKFEGDFLDVYELSKDLVARLLPYTEQIAAVRRQLDLKAVLQVVLWITIDDSKPTPATGFEPGFISFLNQVGASIDIDTYRNVP